MKILSDRKASVRQNLSHENYGSDEPTETGSNRAFGCTVGAILMAIGAARAFIAGAATPVSFLLIGAGAGLVLFGIAAPSRLAVLNRLWLRLGVVISKIVNPIVMAILFYFVISPMALVMRMAGRRPLGLATDPAAPSYWIPREPPEGGKASMRRQF
jgi:Saxitoxin biosynthesis operon protein SxtJ